MQAEFLYSITVAWLGTDLNDWFKKSINWMLKNH